MSNIFSSSIGKKIVMSLSGLFLLVFLLVHLVANLFIFVGAEAYDAVCHFMDTNPLIRVMVPVLALGFAIHIVYAFILTLRNMKARPVKYAVKKADATSTWASRNMLILGLLVVLAIPMHLYDFWAHMQLQTFLGNEMTVSPYDLIVNKFTNLHIVVMYVLWIVVLWMHLTHGFWSAFQSLGLSNNKWHKRLKCIGLIYAYTVCIGFIAIPLYIYFINL